MKKSLLLLSSCSLFAGPPMLTNDPFVPDYGEFEINIAVSVEKDSSTLYQAPIIDFNYGLLPNMQFTLESAYSINDDGKDIDSLEVGIKYLWYEGDSFAISSVTNYVSYPLDSVFDEGNVYEIGFATNFKMSENLNLIFTPMYVYKNSENYHFEVGSYLNYNYDKQSFYGEIFAEESEIRDREFLLLNLGYLWQFHKNVAFMFSLGKEILHHNKNAFISYSGLQIVF